MCHKIVVLGAGGHAKVVADIIIKTKNILIGFLDDNVAIGNTIIRYNNQELKVIGKINDSIKLFNQYKDLEFIIAIGNNEIRKSLSNEYNLPYTTLVHPSANIGVDVKLGKGTVIMPNVIINPGTNVGNHCIINSGAIIEHDNIIEDYVHVSPNATLCGTVKIGAMTHIGAGSTVKNNIEICGGCVIGAGSVVVKDILEQGTYIGVPSIRMEGKRWKKYYL